MKKIDIEDFCDEISTMLDDFRVDMISKNFSKRNVREWYKMLGDYGDMLPISYFDEDDGYDRVPDED